MSGSVCNADGTYNVALDGRNGDPIIYLLKTSIPLGLRLTYITTLVLYDIPRKTLLASIILMTELRILTINPATVLRLPNNMNTLKKLHTLKCKRSIEPKWMHHYGYVENQYVVTQTVLQRLYEYQTYTGAIYAILAMAPIGRDVRQLICVEILNELVRPRHECYNGFTPTILFTPLPSPTESLTMTWTRWNKLLFASGATFAMHALGKANKDKYYERMYADEVYALIGMLRDYGKPVSPDSMNGCLFLLLRQGKFATAREFLRRCYNLLMNVHGTDLFTCCCSNCQYTWDGDYFIKRDYYLFSDVCNFTP